MLVFSTNSLNVGLFVQDLIAPEDRHVWSNYFARQGQAVAFVDATRSKGISDLLPASLRIRGLLPIPRDGGAQLILAVGLPNTGKSTVINALRTRCWAGGARPGATGAVAKVGEWDSPCSAPRARADLRIVLRSEKP